MINILFTDCESNGFAKFKTPSANQLTGRVISLAWILTDANGTSLSQHSYLIRPEGGWRIPQEEWWIKHGFFQSKSLQEGYPIKQVLELFLLDYNKAEAFCCHNIHFDKKLVFAELNRARLITNNQPHEYCTMRDSKHHCGFKNSVGAIKNPTLSELYFFLFGKEFEGAHSALGDVTAAKECFFELVRLGIIKLPETV